ncbi:hypothetical protein Goklo_026712 [Gossypium klotzschianum]|uniref:RNase H type-1 domain-containing protein n=1 Tax=Gossypium klotzschianum TaxID=34286 RepID=A0A7J8TVR9_9ROSI|nr:hypothetical protein [Gossypium klotzschianum]
MDPNEITKVSLRWATQFSSVYTAVSKRRSPPLCTPSFPGTCVYLNTGGATQMNTGLSAPVFVAELWGILDGLLLLYKQGHDRVLILSAI